MIDAHELTFAELPSLGRAYLRGLWPQRKPGLAAGQNIPRIVARIEGVCLDPAQVAKYRKICSLPDNAFVPLTLPQVMAAGLFAEIMLSPAFPLSAWSLVHVGNEIRAERALALDEKLDFVCWVEGQRQAKRGLELDLIAEVSVEGQTVWTGIMTVLKKTSRRKTKSGPTGPKIARGESPGTMRSVIWHLGGRLGRRYARVSGDYNPIHLSRLSARIFGFKRPIIHGMWLLSKVLSELDADLPAYPLRYLAQFKRPVYLPGSVLLSSRKTATGDCEFELSAETDPGKQHVSGTLQHHDA